MKWLLVFAPIALLLEHFAPDRTLLIFATAAISIVPLAAIMAQATSVLAEKLGLDHQKLFDISSKSSGQCWSMTTYCPVPGPVPTSPANRDYQPGFTAAMMLKDLKLAQEAAKAAKAHTQLGAEATKVYERYAGKESNKDFSGVIRMIRDAS